MFYRHCRVRETSPGTHTFFHTYTCLVYCWCSVQLLDFGLFGNLIHASQPIRKTFTGQCFAYDFLQTSPHGDALAFGCILPTAGWTRDFHPLERKPAWHTKKYEWIIINPPVSVLTYSLLSAVKVNICLVLRTMVISANQNCLYIYTPSNALYSIERHKSLV